MSTDFQVVCHHCKKSMHLGQHMGGIDTFGYGSGDWRGRRFAAGFVFEHLNCQEVGSSVEILHDYPDGYEEVYEPSEREPLIRTHAERLADLYEEFGERVIANNHVVNLTKLHDYLFGEDVPFDVMFTPPQDL